MGIAIEALSEPFTYQSAPAEPEQADGFDISTGEAHHYDGLFERYAASRFGVYHATQVPRYSNRYAYNPPDMLADLGDDVHPLRHMPYTESAIFTPLVAHQHQSDAQSFQHFEAIEVVAGRLGVLLHDTGECEHPELKELCDVEVVGDVNFWEKDEAVEQVETIIRRYFYQSLYADVPDEIMKLAEDMVANKAGTRLREAFATTEHIGYYVTGIRAGKKALELQPGIRTDDDELRVRQLSRIAISTTGSWHRDLIDRGNTFPYTWVILNDSTEMIDAIHTQLVGD